MKSRDSFSKRIRSESFGRTLLLLFLVSISLGTRMLLHTFTPGFHEYESAFLYVSDIALVLLLVWIWFASDRRGVPLARSIRVLIGFVVVFAIFSIIWAPSWALAVYSLARLILFMVLAISIRRLQNAQKIFIYIVAAITLFALIQAFIGISQFSIQGNLGLTFLGESPIDAFDPGTSKSIVGDARVVRAYGTFPHPNILGSFLTLGLGALYYFWLSVRIPKLHVTRKNCLRAFRTYFPVLMNSILLGMGIFVVLAGITLTFSRVSWLVAGLVSCAMLIYGLIISRYRRQARKLFVTLIAAFGMLMILFSPFVIPRAQVSLGEPSVTSRISYVRLAGEILQTHPMGVGIGNQVWYAAEHDLYKNEGFRTPAEWQPIHNLYLLIATEIGIGGFLSFIGLVVAIYFGLFMRGRSLDRMLVGTLLTAFIIFGLFDHFLWTIQQGGLMLWLLIGLALLISHPRSK